MIGYYRLSGYLYPFLELPKSEHRYKRGSTLGGAVSLYEFDRELRQLVFDQIERIEIAVRSTITNIVCAETGDVFWMTNPSRFAHTDKYNKTLLLVDKELQNSREDFISHFKHTYDEPYPPSWMIVEIIPLGTLTRLYENIASHQVRKRIARSFGLTVPVFISWMTIVTLTRNTCCHHARLWNRSLSLRALTMTRPIRPWIDKNVQQGRVFFTLCILKYFIDIICLKTHSSSVWWICWQNIRWWIRRQWVLPVTGKSNRFGRMCHSAQSVVLFSGCEFGHLHK